MSTPTVYPLTWPRGRVRMGGIKNGQFKYKSASGWMEPVTIAMAVERLQDQVWKLGGRNLLLSTNLIVGKNGGPLSKQAKPDDPGACAYFSLDGKAMALACDMYLTVEQNIAALAAHVEATRAIERHGVATAAETLRAFEALAGPEATPSERPWWEVFGIDRRSGVVVIQSTYRRLAKDRQDDETALKQLNVARDSAVRELTGGQ